MPKALVVAGHGRSGFNVRADSGNPGACRPRALAARSNSCFPVVSVRDDVNGQLPADVAFDIEKPELTPGVRCMLAPTGSQAQFHTERCPDR